MLQVIKDPYKDRYIIVGNRSQLHPERNGFDYTKAEAECVMRKICLLSAADAVQDEAYDKADSFLSNFAGKPVHLFDTSEDLYQDDLDAMKRLAEIVGEHCYDRSEADQQCIEMLRTAFRSGASLCSLLSIVSHSKQKRREPMSYF